MTSQTEGYWDFGEWLCRINAVRVTENRAEMQEKLKEEISAGMPAASAISLFRTVAFRTSARELVF